MNLHAHPTSSLSVQPEDWQSATLISVLTRWADERPDRIVYTWLEDGESVERNITFSALYRQASEIAEALVRFVKAGDRVILLYGDGPDYIFGLMGCLIAGAVPVSGIHPGTLRAFERFVGIAGDCNARAVIGSHQVLSEFQATDEDAVDALNLRWLASDRLPAKRPGQVPAVLPGLLAQNNDLAVIQYTSGSTRAPRGVALTHRNILHNVHMQSTAFEYEADDVGVSWLPFSHDMGLIGAVLMALYAGGRCVLFAPSHFLEKPERWLKAVSHYRASISGGPNFAYDLCARRIAPEVLGSLDLSRWALAFNGAEPIRHQVLSRFADFAAPAGFRAEALYPCYGLAEGTLFVSGGQRGGALRLARIDRRSLQSATPRLADESQTDDNVATLVGCGSAHGGQMVEIVNPQTGDVVPAGDVGEIWVSGPSVSSGYFGREGENAAIFNARLPGLDERFLRTGDLGFMLDGELYITGRERDLLVLRGKNHYPQDIEQTAEEAHGALKKGASAAFMSEDETVQGFELVVEVGHLDDEERLSIAKSVAGAVAAIHGVCPNLIRLVAPGSVLKTPSGKIQRSQTRTALAEGRIVSLLDFQPLAAVESGISGPAQSFESFLAETIARSGPDVLIADLGFDSLKLVEMKTELEQSLGVMIPASDLYRLNTLGELSAYIAGRAHQRDNPEAAQPGLPVAEVAPRAPSRLADQRRIRTSLNKTSLM